MKLQRCLLVWVGMALLGLSCAHGSSDIPMTRNLAASPSAGLAQQTRLQTRVSRLRALFDEQRALETVAFVERFFRVRGNEGYQRSLQRVGQELRRCGFPESATRTLQLGDERETWTPRRASLQLRTAETWADVIRFDSEAERDRATLFVGSASVSSQTFRLLRAESVPPGDSLDGAVVLVDGSPGEAYRTFVESGGAQGVLVRYLASYHQSDRFPDAAQFGYLPRSSRDGTFGFSLSQRNWERLRRATLSTDATIRIDIDVRRSLSRASAVELTIPGQRPELGAVVLVAHVDEPGANDNGSGVAALAEMACAMQRGLLSGAFQRPLRPLVFLWGQEMEIARAWLETSSQPASAGLVLDMVGEDPTIVGAPFLIERMPDPGAIWLRDPDRHTEWGASEVREEQVRGHFLNDYAAAAVGTVALEDPEFVWRTNPFEGGSDHVPFLERGLPAILGWHFTDSAYHTTLDRLDRVSAVQMERVAAAIGAVALGLASVDPGDIEEMRVALEMASRTRFQAALRAGRARVDASGDPELELHVLRAWVTFYDAAFERLAAWREDLPAQFRNDIEAAQVRWRIYAQEAINRLAAAFSTNQEMP